MKISQIAKLSDVSSKTIRYYEDIGLMPEAPRNANDYREYDKSAIDKLIFIRRCRELQIPLEQIKQLVLVKIDKTASCHEVDRIIETQLIKVRKTRKELALLEKSLGMLAKSCHQDRVSDCEILHQLTKD